MVSDVQVQNLTPQLVNAGTIKMTYPENKVLMRMMARMMIIGQRYWVVKGAVRSAQIPAFEQPMFDGGWGG